jgi:hypothetical protein
MTTRSASFTAAESGNAFATSGSRTATFVPAAKRRAYLPRWGFPIAEKSYSARMSETSELLRFFIEASLTAGDTPSCDDPDEVGAMRVSHHKDTPGRAQTEGQVSEFRLRVVRVAVAQRQRVLERRDGLIEGHPVPPQVESSLVRIPFDAETH